MNKIINPLNEKTNKLTFYLIVFIQFLLCYYAFYNFINFPNKYVFNSVYDGIKNYYVVASYIQQNAELGLKNFYGFNYPYGDTIFFTDNSPIFSITYKLLAYINIVDGNNVIYYYNLFFVLCTFLSSIITYKIIKRFISNQYFIFAISVSTPWICQQINRLSQGHFNLSISLYLLISILLLLNIYDKYLENKSNLKNFFYLYILIIISSFTHLYYFPIIIFTSTIFLGILSIEYYFQKTNKRFEFGIDSVICITVSVITVYSILILFDNHASERLPAAQGYNWTEWKFNFFTLIRPYDYINVKYLITSTRRIPFESYSYLGTGTLYILTLVFIMLFIKSERVKLIEYLKNHKYAKFLLYFSIAGFICFIISIGSDYYFMNSEYYFTNYLNPFYYLVDIIPILKQFRCLARFSWPLILFIQLFIALLLNFLYNQNRFLKFFAILFVTLNLANAYESARYLHKNIYLNPLNRSNLSEDFNQIINFVDSTKSEYQAIITIPFFHAGSENYDYTIDPEDNFSTNAMQLSYFTELPLMSSKMGRTSFEQTKNLFDIYLQKKIPEDILNRLNDKKILVYVDNGFYNGNKTWPEVQKEPASTTIKTGKDILEALECKKIYSKKDIELYEVTIKK